MAASDKSDKYEDDDNDREDDDGLSTSAPPADDADDDDEDDDDEDDDEPQAKSSSTSRKKKTGAKKSGGRSRRVVDARRRKPAASPARNIIIYGVLIGGIAVLFVALGGLERSSKPPRPTAKWDVGQTVDLPITLVTPDVDDLACATDEKVKDLYCSYLGNGKPGPQKERNARTAPKMLQPFTTTDGRNFLAAGLWTQPLLKQKLAGENPNNPSPRFAVVCKLTVQGKVSDVKVRWKPPPEGGWQDVKDWYAGTVSDCRIKSPNRKQLPARPIKPRRVDKPKNPGAESKGTPKDQAGDDKAKDDQPKDGKGK